MIVGKPLLAGLKEFCSNKASVELLQNLYEGVADSIYQLTTYQDVEVRIKKGEKYRFFQGMYAKVTSIEGRNLRLRFTTELNMLSDRDWKWGVDVIGKGKYVPENIQIVQITADEMVQMVNMAEVLQQTASLYWTKEAERVKILFVSNQKEIRALEFLDYVVENYAIVKGNETKAQAMLDTVFLQVMMSEREVDTIEALFQKIIKQYYTECQWIYAREFVRDNEELIRMLPMYCKKRVPWAYVKATNIAKEGEQICLKSLENESGIVLDISANLYIMIGYRGETYHIDKDKFESTYEISDETLDAYEMMLDYLPEVMKCENGEFVCLEDLAYLCYPKSDKTIYAKELDCRVKVFNPYNNGEYFLGRAGDYLAIREDDLEDIYIIQQEIFYDTYVKKENKVEP